MTAILRLLARSGIVIDNPFFPSRDYQRPQVGDAARDYYKITGDMRWVAQDLKIVTESQLGSHGKSAH